LLGNFLHFQRIPYDSLSWTIGVMGQNSDLPDPPFESGHNRAGPGAPTETDLFAQPFESRMAAAREGSLSAIESIFEECRNYLLLIANRELGHSMQDKIGATDLVQQTFLQGQQILDRFAGGSRQDLAAWLAQILEDKLAQAQGRLPGTEKRDPNRETPLSVAAEDLLRNLRLADFSRPDQAAANLEDVEALKSALDRLPADHRLAIELRSLQQQSFADLGRVLDRSPDEARITWARALLQLRQELRQNGRMMKDEG
jgi:RNA polymerase sigma-70 factor (ECF subfamily)